MKEVLTNNDSYYPSHNYPSKVTKFSTKAWHQQLDLVPLIHLCSVISLTIDKQKKLFAKGVQTRLSTLKL
jgi:hypothetical protein